MTCRVKVNLSISPRTHLKILSCAWPTECCAAPGLRRRGLKSARILRPSLPSLATAGQPCPPELVSRRKTPDLPHSQRSLAWWLAQGSQLLRRLHPCRGCWPETLSCGRFQYSRSAHSCDSRKRRRFSE